MGIRAERMRGNVADHVGEAGMADWEAKDSKPLAVKYCGGCNYRRNSQSHRRVCWNVRIEWSEWAALFPL